MSQPDESHFKVVINAIREGGIVPFFGAGINLCDRPEKTVWTAEQYEYMPSGTELAEYLTDKFIYQKPGATIKCGNCNFENQAPPPKLLCESCKYPISIFKQDLARVSQYVDLMTGSAPLYNELHQVFDQEYKVTSAHGFFASLPTLMRERGYYPQREEIASLLAEGKSYQEIEEYLLFRRHYSPPQLIVTTNYDDLMERAFNQAGEAFDLLWYGAYGKNRGKLLHKPANENKIYPVDRPREYKRPLLIQHPVILKIHGAVKRGTNNVDEDSYVITEDHYIDYLTRTEIEALIPARLVAKLRRCHFLFLGYGLRDWNLRVIMHRISGDQKLSYKSWAIQTDFQEIDKQFWSRRNVDLYSDRLDKYISDLNQRFLTIEPKPAPTSTSLEDNH